MRKLRAIRWDFICSYGGMLTAGIGVYLIALAVYLARTEAVINKTATAAVRDFPVMFVRHSIPVLVGLTVFMAVCNITAFHKEGRRFKNLLGTAFFVICLCMAYVCSFWHLTAMLACYMELFFLGSTIMSYAAALNRPRLDNDYLIILGCYIGKKKRKLLPLLRARLNRAIRFAWEQEIATGKAICYVPTGGQGSDEIMSEGSAMEMYLLSHSAEQYEILVEKSAANTYENFLFSKRLIEEKNKDAAVAYITTNYHVLRSGILARRAGIRAEGLAASTKWYYWPNAFIREFIAISVMYKYQHALACALVIVLFFALY